MYLGLYTYYLLYSLKWPHQFIVNSNWTLVKKNVQYNKIIDLYSIRLEIFANII